MNNPIARVLSIEDHDIVARLIRCVLASAEIETTIANSGGHGLAAARGSKFDLILLDVDLPDMSGFEVCRRLKQEDALKHIPVVFVSGQQDPEYSQEASRLGAVDYIVKPFDATEFPRRILEHIQRSRSGGEPPAAT